MRNLIDLVEEDYIREFNKHKDVYGEYGGYTSANQYAEHMVNSLTNHELLNHISQCLNEMMESQL